MLSGNFRFKNKDAPNLFSICFIIFLEIKRNNVQ